MGKKGIRQGTRVCPHRLRSCNSIRSRHFHPPSLSQPRRSGTRDLHSISWQPSPMQRPFHHRNLRCYYLRPFVHRVQLVPEPNVDTQDEASSLPLVLILTVSPAVVCRHREVHPSRTVSATERHSSAHSVAVRGRALLDRLLSFEVRATTTSHARSPSTTTLGQNLLHERLSYITFLPLFFAVLVISTTSCLFLGGPTNRCQLGTSSSPVTHKLSPLHNLVSPVSRLHQLADQIDGDSEDVSFDPAVLIRHQCNVDDVYLKKSGKDGAGSQATTGFLFPGLVKHKQATSTTSSLAVSRSRAVQNSGNRPPIPIRLLVSPLPRRRTQSLEASLGQPASQMHYPSLAGRQDSGKACSCSLSRSNTACLPACPQLPRATEVVPRVSAVELAAPCWFGTSSPSTPYRWWKNSKRANSRCRPIKLVVGL